MSTVLTINGSTVARGRITLNKITESMDTFQTLEFTEKSVVAGNGTYHQGQSCTLVVDSIAVFTGVIVSADPIGIGAGPIDVGYRAMDLSFLANNLRITAEDGTGVLTYNMPTTDPDYLLGNAGKSIGSILQAVFDLHATALSAVGVTGYNSAELAALICVPPEPVILSGALWSACQQLVAQWCNKYAIWIDGSGLIHVANTFTGLTGVTLTLDSDPVVLDSISRDHSECFTQAIARGGANIQGAYLRLSDGSLTAAWTSSQQSAWTVTDYYQPKSGYDTGSISSMTSTTITITSDTSTEAWATNYWGIAEATLWVLNTSATGITFQEMRTVISCTSMTAGGSATITVDTPFDNSGYNKYILRSYLPANPADTGTITGMTSTVLTVESDTVTRIWGSNYWLGQSAVILATGPGGISEKRTVTACGALAAGGTTTFTVGTAFSSTAYTRYQIRGTLCDQSLVWRKFTIPNSWIAEHLEQRFNHSVPFSASTAAVSLTNQATAVVCWSTTGSPPYNMFPVTLQVVDYDGVVDGYLVFDQPILFPFNTRTQLESGGSSVQAPNDLIVLVPYSRGALTAQQPSSGYQGTAYTVDGVQRTLYVDYPDWLSATSTSTSQMAQLAQEILDTRKDTVVEGTLTYYGKNTTFLTLGKALNIARSGGTTGWESLAAPVRSVSLEWPQSGPNIWVTRINFSTRRRPFSGDRLYVHPAYGHGGLFLGGVGGWASSEGEAIGFSNSMVESRAASFGDASDIEAPDMSGLDQRRRRPAEKADKLSEYDRNRIDADQRENARRAAKTQDRKTSEARQSLSPIKSTDPHDQLLAGVTAQNDKAERDMRTERRNQLKKPKLSKSDQSLDSHLQDLMDND